MVIGTGMAGSAAALFAANRGVSVVQVGIISEIIFASGLLDLMGVHPIQKQRIWDNPWAAIDTVSKDIPGHPYAKLNEK
ncbi:MAG: FAD-binding protein, partial [Desulfobacterales bacterium]